MIKYPKNPLKDGPTLAELGFTTEKLALIFKNLAAAPKAPQSMIDFMIEEGKRYRGELANGLLATIDKPTEESDAANGGDAKPTLAPTDCIDNSPRNVTPRENETQTPKE